MKYKLTTLISTIPDAVRHEGGSLKLCKKVFGIVLSEGMSGIRLRILHLLINRGNHPSSFQVQQRKQQDYADWLATNESFLTENMSHMSSRLEKLNRKPLISVIMPTYEPDIRMLEEAVESVKKQIYPNWQLCIADDGSKSQETLQLLRKLAKSNDRIDVEFRHDNGNISAATNTALSIVRGDYVAFLDQDDLLSADALLCVAARLDSNPDLKLIYSDEDKIDSENIRSDPHFKPDWNYDYFLSNNYLCHLIVYSTEIVKKIGGMRLGYEGSQDFDLALRVIESIEKEDICHIPHILYHWRMHDGSTAKSIVAKPHALQAGMQAIRDHLDRIGQSGNVSLQGIKYRVKYPISAPIPNVTILIPTRNQQEYLTSCIESIKQKTDYRNYEILIIDNGSDQPAALTLLESIQNDNIRVLRDARAFNFSALINNAMEEVDTELVCFLNNDVEVINTDWLSELVSHAVRPHVAIVGAKLLYADNTVQHGGIILGIGGFAGHSHKHFPADASGYFDRLILQQELSAVSAACMLTHCRIFRQIGGFDEVNLPIAFNDVDYCLEAAALGMKVVWTPYARLYHYESKSRGIEDAPEKQARFQREGAFIRKKWGRILDQDPAYNPNLTDTFEDFSFAVKSRAKRFSAGK